MNTDAKKIEIEFRAVFDEVKYRQLDNFLREKAEDLGNDDKKVMFFIMTDKLVKVVDDILRNGVKIVLKLNKIGKGSDFEEMEVSIPRDEVGKAEKLFRSLGLTDNVMRSFQRRHNYSYRGVELALKHSNVWGYHLELEIVMNDLNKKIEAEAVIRSVAEELGVRLMTDEELAEFTKKAEEDYRKNICPALNQF